MMSEFKMELSELVAAPGYIKGSITRIHNSINLKGASEALKTQRDRLMTAFKEYERYNIAILSADPSDAEKFDEYETKYVSALSMINEELNSRSDAASNSKPQAHLTPTHNQIRLPPIEIPVFSDQYTARAYHLERDSSKKPSINEFLDFLGKRALALENSEPERLQTQQGSAGQFRQPASSKMVGHLAGEKVQQCAYCKCDHRIFTCKAFKLLTSSERIKFTKSKSLCMICLGSHAGKCRFHFRCAECKQAHNTLLHCENVPPAIVNPVSQASVPVTPTAINQAAAFPATQTGNKQASAPVTPAATNQAAAFPAALAGNKQASAPVTPAATNQAAASADALAAGNINNNDVLLPTAKVKVIARDGREVHLKALLDSGSQLSFISEKAVQLLGLTPTPNNTNIIGITNSKGLVKYCLPVEVQSLITPYKVETTCHVVKNITCKLPQYKFDLTDFTIPPNIRLADEEFNIPSEIDLLMGADVVFQALLPMQPLSSEQEQQATLAQPDSLPPQRPDVEPRPNIINTQFGHVIGGSIPKHKSPKVCNKVSLKCTTCESEISKSLTRFWQVESVPQIFNERSSEQELCEKIFRETVQLKDNQFQVALPLKIPLDEVRDTLGDSFHFALKRFLNLEKKFHQNPDFFAEYQKFIHEYLTLNHGHYVDIEMYDLNKDAVYFLPHHGVVKADSKTTRLRSVFDGSMKTNKKVSLNDLLLNGPIVQRDLFDIILLFRFGDYTFTTDIKRMFRNIRLVEEHTSLQNILWRDSPNENIKCIRLDTVSYGLKSSSYLATRCLDEIATRYERELPLASFIIKNNTYIDDILYSANSLEKVIEAKSQLRKLLSLGSFETHKWSSNNGLVLGDTPSTEQHFDEIELQKDSCSLKALGLHIVTKEDRFKMSCPEPFNPNKVTKRDILSHVSKFYDPLGLVSPIIVKAKAIMQKIWSTGTDWNAVPPEDIKKEWIEFASSLAVMEPIYFNRNVHVNDSDTVQIIGFSDASSSTAYGCCVYLRVTDCKGIVTMHLLCSKSRINPLQNKGMTVPRLELNAALLLSKLVARVRSTFKLKINVHGVYLFVDSQIVLAWMRTELTRLQAYVANRVKVIKEHTAEFNWLYVNSRDNPADLISRGVNPQELGACSLWFVGPAFLHDSEYKFNSNLDMPADLPEIKAAAASNQVSAGPAAHDNVFERLRKQKAEAARQLMGSLPAERVTATTRAFVRVGIDFAGPISQCTQLKQSFWKMWYKQYLNTLQNRPKWRLVNNNVTVGRLVILREDNCPPMSRPMARITKVYPGHDGLVRAVEVKTSNSKAHTRSITKISLLPLDNDS
ncbi:uncharacterized protein [Battus philenor]|uniref:uncharacterized protein n=1 Tax=Battus philenor TaxID=42288 RepID=UPI0035D0314D